MKWKKSIIFIMILTLSLILAGNCIAQNIGMGTTTGIYPFEEAFGSFELFASMKFMRPVKKEGPEGEPQTVYKNFWALQAGVWFSRPETFEFETAELAAKVYLLSWPDYPCVLYTGAGSYLELEQPLSMEALGFFGLLGTEIEVVPHIAILSEFRINTKFAPGIPSGPMGTIGAKFEF